MASGAPEDGVEQVERSRVTAAEASWALRRVTRAAAEIDQVLARRVGMRPLDYSAMTHVLTGDGSVGPRELSVRLGISTGSASELVDRLARAGHLRREPHRDDRRRISLQATDAAVQRILGELTPVLTALDDLADEFTDDELDIVVRYLRSATQILRTHDADA